MSLINRSNIFRGVVEYFGEASLHMLFLQDFCNPSSAAQNDCSQLDCLAIRSKRQPRPSSSTKGTGWGGNVTHAHCEFEVRFFEAITASSQQWLLAETLYPTSGTCKPIMNNRHDSAQCVYSNIHFMLINMHITNWRPFGDFT